MVQQQVVQPAVRVPDVAPDEGDAAPGVVRVPLSGAVVVLMPDARSIAEHVHVGQGVVPPGDEVQALDSLLDTGEIAFQHGPRQRHLAYDDLAILVG